MQSKGQGGGASMVPVHVRLRILRQAFSLGRVRSRKTSVFPQLFILYGFTPFLPHGGHLEHKCEGLESLTRDGVNA